VPDNKASSSSALPEDEVEDGALALHNLDNISEKKPKNFLTKQPAMLPDGVKLKDYQLLGVNWLNLLYSRKYSCILADEMGS
jgi:SWI/SNF-related matrix-associated actin-dependent regulator of chromatin subfamily A containing DEAD/H box 1